MVKVISIISLILLFFTSCNARINGVLTRNGQADLQISASLEPRMASLLRRLADVSGSDQSGILLLDGPAISASFLSASGVSSAALKNISSNDIEGPVKILNLNEFLSGSFGGSLGGSQKSFIEFSQSNSSGTGRCTISLNLDSGPSILALISPDVTDYLSALMAPIATGEILTKEEYLSLVSSVWGKGIADEIAGAKLLASIEFPGIITKVKGGGFSGKKADFNIPVLDILVLESALSYEVEWKLF